MESRVNDMLESFPFSLQPGFQQLLYEYIPMPATETRESFCASIYATVLGCLACCNLLGLTLPLWTSSSPIVRQAVSSANECRNQMLAEWCSTCKVGIEPMHN
jgi:hypothetical protein